MKLPLEIQFDEDIRLLIYRPVEQELTEVTEIFELVFSVSFC